MTQGCAAAATPPHPEPDRQPPPTHLPIEAQSQQEPTALTPPDTVAHSLPTPWQRPYPRRPYHRCMPPGPELPTCTVRRGAGP